MRPIPSQVSLFCAVFPLPGQQPSLCRPHRQSAFIFWRESSLFQSFLFARPDAKSRVVRRRLPTSAMWGNLQLALKRSTLKSPRERGSAPVLSADRHGRLGPASAVAATGDFQQVQNLRSHILLHRGYDLFSVCGVSLGRICSQNIEMDTSTRASVARFSGKKYAAHFP